MLEKPFISVVLPTFNRRELLMEAVKSVLAQDSKEFELIISDNCSTDGTETAVKHFLNDPRVKYFRNDSNLGMVGNWRKAIFERATASWFMILSDDDLLTDDTYLSRAIALIRANPSIKFVYGGGFVVDDETGNREQLRPPFSGLVGGRDIFLARGTLKPQDIMLCNMIFPIQEAKDFGFLNNEDNLSCDSELYLKLSLTGDAGVIQDPVSIYRFHQGNLIKRVMTSARYIRGNLDFLVEPYVLAKSKLSEDDLRVYRDNILFDDVIRGSLLRLAVHSEGNYQAARNWLRQRLPDRASIIESGLKYKFKLATVRLFRGTLRSRYGIVD